MSVSHDLEPPFVLGPSPILACALVNAARLSANVSTIRSLYMLRRSQYLDITITEESQRYQPKGHKARKWFARKTGEFSRGPIFTVQQLRLPPCAPCFPEAGYGIKLESQCGNNHPDAIYLFCILNIPSLTYRQRLAGICLNPYYITLRFAYINPSMFTRR